MGTEVGVVLECEGELVAELVGHASRGSECEPNAARCS